MGEQTKIKDWHVVLQKCSVCGELYPFIYLYDERKLEPFSSHICKDIEAGAPFSPYGGISFREWMIQQDKVRSGEAC